MRDFGFLRGKNLTRRNVFDLVGLPFESYSVRMSRNTHLAVLAGGVGAAKFINGLVSVCDGRQVKIIGNTADDIEQHGLSISPDIDTLIYTLAGRVDPQQGWGIQGDTFETLDALDRLGEETWFRLGDQDIATHLVRTSLRKQGWTSTAIARAFSKKFDLSPEILPMTDQSVLTEVLTSQGWMHFQEFFVKYACKLDMKDVAYRGMESAKPTSYVLNAIREAYGILICPSNPIASIGPILALPGIPESFRARTKPCVAVSPIVGGKALKGPAAEMLRTKGFSSDVLGVARFYKEMIDGIVIDQIDADFESPIRDEGIEVLVTNTLMTTPQDSMHLAQTTLDWMKSISHDQHRRSCQKPVHC